VDKGVVQVTTSAAKALASYIAVQIARTVLFLVVFVVLLIVWAFISRALDLVSRLPVLNAVNRWCGAVLGLGKGFLLVYIAVWLFADGLIGQETVDASVLLRFFATTSPLSLIPMISR
jgi:uncharacterized membrane protein required for colicin V production